MIVLASGILAGGGVTAASPGPGTPSPSPAAAVLGAASPSPSPSRTVADPAGEPSPVSPGAVLLVRSAGTLTPHETRWLADLSAELGEVEVLPAGEATGARLLDYLVVYVIEELPDLDAAALADAYAAGRTIALVGGAAAYREPILASEPP